MSKKETIERAAKMTMIKSAANDFSFKGVSKLLGVIGAGLIINQFVKKMVEHAEDKYLEYKEPEYYEAMIKKNKELLKEDPQEVMDLWSTLYKNSPSLAQDPIAAGGFITQNVQMRQRPDMGGPALPTYESLTSIERDKRDLRDAPKDGMAGMLAAGFDF